MRYCNHEECQSLIHSVWFESSWGLTITGVAVVSPDTGFF